MLEGSLLRPRSAFEGLLRPVGAATTAGVIVRDRSGLQIAAVIARAAQEALQARIRVRHGIEVPLAAKRVGSKALALVGIGPGAWLAIREGGGPLIAELQDELGETAAVSDQSDGYGVLRLSGSKVRAALEKGLDVDLHPRAFRSGDAAATSCAHLAVILWQLDEAPTYEVAVFRSLASAFWHWLEESAAEFGLNVDAEDD